MSLGHVPGTEVPVAQMEKAVAPEAERSQETPAPTPAVPRTPHPLQDVRLVPRASTDEPSRSLTTTRKQAVDLIGKADGARRAAVRDLASEDFDHVFGSFGAEAEVERPGLRAWLGRIFGQGRAGKASGDVSPRRGPGAKQPVRRLSPPSLPTTPFRPRALDTIGQRATLAAPAAAPAHSAPVAGRDDRPDPASVAPDIAMAQVEPAIAQSVFSPEPTVQAVPVLAPEPSAQEPLVPTLPSAVSKSPEQSAQPATVAAPLNLEEPVAEADDRDGGALPQAMPATATFPMATELRKTAPQSEPSAAVAAALPVTPTAGEKSASAREKPVSFDEVRADVRECIAALRQIQNDRRKRRV